MTAAILVAGCAVGLTACSSGTSTSSSTQSASPRTTSPAQPGSAIANPATCKHVSSLRGSLETLSHLQLSASSAGQIRTNLNNIQSQLSQLKSQGGGAFSQQVNQLSTSLSEVKKAANNVSTPPSAAQVSKIVTALSGLQTQSNAAVAKMNTVCPKT
jgi:hypothetical protein